jgi:hypothetical protein
MNSQFFACLPAINHLMSMQALDDSAKEECYLQFYREVIWVGDGLMFRMNEIELEMERRKEVVSIV